MIKKIDHRLMGRSKLGWLESWFHFSFAEYHNPNNMHYGPVRVINDDLIKAHTGFDTHPHQDMEIITYVVQGELTHGDSMKNGETLYRGEAQYMSAGTGVAHSEYNQEGETLRIIQIWIIPDREGYTPRYADYRFPWEDRVNRWLHLASGENGNAPIKLRQDVNLFVTQLEDGRTLDYSLDPHRQAYLVVVEGSVQINDVKLEERDAAQIRGETMRLLKITPQPKAHILLFEMEAE